MKQLEYYLEESDLDRQKQIGSCLGLFMKERMDLIREKAATCLKTQSEITASFEEALESGAGQALGMAKEGEKKAVRFIHFSYLYSGALSGETLIKVDYYDDTYFSDICDIDCYWDYGRLFPERMCELSNLEERLRLEIVRLTPYELQQARLYFHTLYFMVLEDILHKLVTGVKSEEIIRSCSDCGVSVLYGAYLDQAKRIHKVLEVGK